MKEKALTGTPTSPLSERIRHNASQTYHRHLKILVKLLEDAQRKREKRARVQAKG